MNINNTMVSIIMPVYNAEKHIQESIESVLKQEYKNLELIIIDDASIDNSLKIAKIHSDSDSRVRIITSKTNSGVSNARNLGLEVAQGRYIAFLDSDDIWTKDKLKKQIAFMINNNVAFSYTSYDMITQEGVNMNKRVIAEKTITYDELLKYSNIGCLTVVLDRNLIKEIKMKNIKHEDFVMWLDITKQGIDAFGLDECLAYYRKTQGSLTSNKFKSALWRWSILTKVEKIPVFKAIYFFFIYAIKSIYKHIL